MQVDPLHGRQSCLVPSHTSGSRPKRAPLLLPYLVVVVVLALVGHLAGCTSTRMVMTPLPPRHVPVRTALRVVVLPFGDSRPSEQESLSPWIAVPLIPYSTRQDTRWDEQFADVEHPDHFRFQVARLLAEGLQQSSIFDSVAFKRDGRIDPSQWDLVITGRVHQSKREELRTLYGVSVAGALFWALGAPTGYDKVTWDLEVELRDPHTPQVYRSFHTTELLKRWRGLYWGAEGFPNEESSALRQVITRAVAELDDALDTVPALASLTAREALAGSVHTLPTSPKEQRAAAKARRALGTILVLGDPSATESQRAFLELVAQAVQQTNSDRVLGLSDLNTLVGLERLNDLLGCTRLDCFADVAGAARADLVLHVTFGTLGEQQSLTIKAVVPQSASVRSRTTWLATGRDPSSFVPQLPTIVGGALGG